MFLLPFQRVYDEYQFMNAERTILVFFMTLNLFLGLLSFSPSLLANDEYRFGVGDKIKIQVYEEPALSFELVIDGSGGFTYPYLKKITLLGKTPTELEKEITEGLASKVLVDPQVTVLIVEYRPFSIGGEVMKPGSYPYEPGLTVIKAINLAGGPTEKGSAERVKLDRINPVEKEVIVSTTEVFPGDTVTVLQQLLVNIGGEVKIPGSYPLEPGLTVKRAINLAGGPTQWSTGRKFKLERAKPVDGEKISLNSVIRSGDTLTVLPRRFLW